MGVYNPFAELPNSCVLCDSRKRCPLPNLNKHGLSVYRHPDCPLVEVKSPHGRLIDADALIAKHEKEKIRDYDFHVCAENWIANAPTVLEAEGKDDG